MHARALHCHEELEHIPMRLAELAGARAVRLQYVVEVLLVVAVFVSLLLLVRMTTSS